ncbi:LamG-like jellyroll fold domain-containing protein [Emticicia sp. W12TSBA100-4]|uniref:LamG-like jellyroll fold domain-containing protein n=1 Tax=Emticicia sp. W12TSBA100-4 TaxID=3160965 RepID=UPI003306583E
MKHNYSQIHTIGVKSLLFIIFTLFISTAFGSHYRGGKIEWIRSPGTRTVTFNTYAVWESASFIGSIYLYTGDGEGTSLAGTEIGSNGTQKIYRYTYTYTYSSDGPFTASYGDCCRISTSSNGADASYSVSTIVNLANNNIGSPASNTPFLITMPINSNNQFQLTGSEPNNGNLTYSVGAIQSTAYLPSAGGNSATVSSSGLLQWNTTGAAVGQEWFMKILMTGNDGITKTELDIIIKITNGGPQYPICLLNGNSTNTVDIGTLFTINLSATDPEGQALTITNQGQPNGMSSVINGNSITYSWTPSISQSGTYTVNTTFTDPTNLSTSCSYNIIVPAPSGKAIISCYPFTGNVNDNSGNNNGTANGGTYTNNRFGLANSAYLLDGTSNYISIPANGLNNANYSISAWVKPYSLPTTSPTPAIITNIGNVGADQAAGFFSVNGVYSIGLIGYGHTALSSPYTPINFQLGSTAPWKHVVYTLQGNNVKYYIDGNLVSSFNTTGSTSYATPVIGTIGARLNVSQFFHGEIDDIMFIKEGINDAEVLALYQTPNACPNNIVNSPLIAVKPVNGKVTIGTPFNVEITLSSLMTNAGNQFEVQLSESDGHFHTVTTIGTGTSTTIAAVLPANLPFSNLYQIRVVSTNPAITSFNTQPISIADKRLVSCYSFSGNTNDGKSSNNGTASGGNFISDRFGNASSAYLLNGTSEYVSIPTANLNNPSYSFSAWVKPYSMPTISGNPSRSILSLGNLGGDQSLLFAYNSSVATSTLQLATSGVTPSNSSYTVNFQASTNAPWKHVVGVLNNNTIKYYVDGNLVSTISTSGTPTYNSPIIGQIGRRISGTQYFHGEIDDVMIYKEELNQAEVSALFNAKVGCPTNIENSALLVLQALTTTNICKGTSFTLNFLVGNYIANTGNTYTAELSDVNGSFSSPIAIGTSNTTSINCTIPSNSVVGNNYKVRIRASNPNLISYNEILINIQGPSAATMSGTSNIQDGNSTNISIAFTGSFPITYTLSNGVTGVANSSPININVAPYGNTTYTISSISNTCGNGIISGNAVVTVQASKQLLSCFPFNGNSLDEVGGSYSSQGGITLSKDRYGKSNSAYYFDGNDNILLQTNALTNPTYTMSAWVKPRFLPNFGEQATILGLMGSGFEQKLSITNSSETYDQAAWLFSSTGSNGVTLNAINFAVDTTKWYHISAVRSTDSLKLYIDGKQVIRIYSGGSAPFYGSVVNGSIGASFTSASPFAYFKGWIDDVKILKGNLNDSEIEELYHSDYCQYTVPTRQAELIACYPFNNNANDSKNNYHGVVNGATLTTDRFGNSNSAYLFDGNDSILLPQTTDFQNRQFTISAWINSTNLPSAGVPQRAVVSLGNNRVLQYTYYGSPATSLVFYNSGNTGNSPFINTANTANQWYHVAAVIEGGNVKLYVNGVLEGGRLGNITNSAFSGLNYIGFRDGTSSYFDGKIDDVKIFKGVMYDAEVKKLYQDELLAPSTCNFIPCVPTILKSSSDGLNANVSHQVVAKNTILTNTTITYEAGKSILLKPGFRADNQSVFKAQIGGCTF